MSPVSITIYHSPDADDAFMFYGLASGQVKVPGYDFQHELCDIESLNHLAMQAKPEATAVSVHALAHLHNRYAVLSAGASMGGQNYGPRIVTKSGDILRTGAKVAIPGELTSAALALRIYAHESGIKLEEVLMHFDEIQVAVQSGEVPYGVIIHEGQLTHAREGLSCVLDLGAWWWSKTGLPLPLGINVVRKDLGTEAIAAVAQVLKASIEYSLAHRKEALEYALQYGRGLNEADADTFVAMYVNEYTRNLGPSGINSIQKFLELGAQYGFVPQVPTFEFV